ncbi:MAG: hypothetical protein JNL63_05550 [Bacteroidia bacterium]|nr:hypothetical protein [Bacteroidia bacterium]
MNNNFEQNNSAELKISRLGLSEQKSAEQNLDVRFQLISRLNPLTSNGADLEDTILQILRETIKDQ